MIYIDSEYRCHSDNAEGTYRAIEINYFDGKCKTYIEGYRFVPAGESWTREDGKVFHGPMKSPWKPQDELDQAQRQYERNQLADMQAALEILGVSVDE